MEKILSAAAIGGAALCASFLVGLQKEPLMDAKLFVLAETEAPASLDPLDSDYFSNLHASQMVHRTILEVKRDNSLDSSLLSHFSYDPERSEVLFRVDPEARFSDGSPITAQDLEMTIKRMALKRPDFPVLKHIVGIRAWVRTENPLSTRPVGLKSDGLELRIRFERDIPEPLFRFALPLFGVVKAEAVDLVANRLKTDAPTSGYYHLSQSELAQGDTVLRFQLNPLQSNRHRGLSESVHVRYRSTPLSKEWLDQLKGDQVVVVGPEGPGDNERVSMSSAAGFERTEQPSARFSVFLLNPNSVAFLNRTTRRVFRETVFAALQVEAPQLPLESSIFTGILPGYLTTAQLAQSGFKMSDAEAEEARKVLEGKSIRWMPTSSHQGSLFEKALHRATTMLRMNLVTVPETDAKERYRAFSEGRLDVMTGGSGFWAFDPVGDLQMLFTPNLHKPLTFVSRDPALQTLLSGLEFEIDPGPRLSSVNVHLFNEALLNVFTHAKRVYYTKGFAKRDTIPIAITPPAPWQVFQNEDQ